VGARRLIELSWRDLTTFLDPANLELVKTDPTVAYLALLAMVPTALSYGFGLQTRVGAADWENHADGGFAGTARLAAAIPIGVDEIVFSLSDMQNLADLAVGDALLIDDEICRVVVYEELLNLGVLTRGCVDTVPAAHAVRPRLPARRCCRPHNRLDERHDRSSAPLTKTSLGTLPEDQALSSKITLVARQARPYPPGNLKINGAVYPATLPDGAVLAATSAAASSADPDMPDPPDYIATADSGEQWIWWRFANTQSLGRITVTGGVTANGKSLADMLNGCDIQYSASTAATPTNWVSTGVTVSGVTDGGSTDFNLPGITCRAIRLYKADG
jgi:hypothetical protein